MKKKRDVRDYPVRVYSAAGEFIIIMLTEEELDENEEAFITKSMFKELFEEYYELSNLLSIHNGLQNNFFVN